MIRLNNKEQPSPKVYHNNNDVMERIIYNDLPITHKFNNLIKTKRLTTTPSGSKR